MSQLPLDEVSSPVRSGLVSSGDSPEGQPGAHRWGRTRPSESSMAGEPAVVRDKVLVITPSLRGHRGFHVVKLLQSAPHDGRVDADLHIVVVDDDQEAQSDFLSLAKEAKVQAPQTQVPSISEALDQVDAEGARYERTVLLDADLHLPQLFLRLLRRKVDPKVTTLQIMRQPGLLGHSPAAMLKAILMILLARAGFTLAVLRDSIEDPRLPQRIVMRFCGGNALWLDEPDPVVELEAHRNPAVPTVAMLGVLSHRKSPHELLDALLVMNSRPNVFIAGPTDGTVDETRFRQQISNLELAGFSVTWEKRFLDEAELNTALRDASVVSVLHPQGISSGISTRCMLSGAPVLCIEGTTVAKALGSKLNGVAVALDAESIANGLDELLSGRYQKASAQQIRSNFRRVLLVGRG